MQAFSAIQKIEKGNRPMHKQAFTVTGSKMTKQEQIRQVRQ